VSAKFSIEPVNPFRVYYASRGMNHHLCVVHTLRPAWILLTPAYHRITYLDLCFQKFLSVLFLNVSRFLHSTRITRHPINRSRFARLQRKAIYSKTKNAVGHLILKMVIHKSRHLVSHGTNETAGAVCQHQGMEISRNTDYGGDRCELRRRPSVWRATMLD
jgi:hypothetical protein